MRFLFVDEIVELAPGRSITAIKKVNEDEDYFQDHFPGFPVVPGVLLVEMMAQTAGKCLDAEKRPRGKAMLAQISAAKFRSWVQPGVTARVQAVIKSNQERYATAHCRVEVDNLEVSTADLFFTFVPIGNFSPSYRDAVLENHMAARASD